MVKYKCLELLLMCCMPPAISMCTKQNIAVIEYAEFIAVIDSRTASIHRVPSFTVGCQGYTVSHKQQSLLFELKEKPHFVHSVGNS